MASYLPPDDKQIPRIAEDMIAEHGDAAIIQADYQHQAWEVIHEVIRDLLGVGRTRSFNDVLGTLSNDRSWLGTVLTAPDKPRPLIPQQATFANRCPLSCRFRPLNPQQQTWQREVARVRS